MRPDINICHVAFIILNLSGIIGFALGYKLQIKTTWRIIFGVFGVLVAELFVLPDHNWYSMVTAFVQITLAMGLAAGSAVISACGNNGGGGGGNNDDPNLGPKPDPDFERPVWTGPTNRIRNFFPQLNN